MRLLVGLTLLAATASAETPIDVALRMEAAFVAVAEQTTPWVVTLHTQGTERSAGPLRGVHPTGGVGSGFIVDADGTIYTNNHVAAAADAIEVSLADGRRFKADLVAGDRGTDVAVVRLLDAPSDLPVAPLGDSEQVRVGQYAIAVGAPFGYESSFSVGHVSATSRRNVGVVGGMVAPGFEDLRYQDFLQVDTPIYPGNSGGPLVDLHGRVIGINTAIAGQAGGLGFAIPINLARKVAGELIAEGRVRRGWLGVALQDLDAVEAETFGLGPLTGAMIAEVRPDSPASRAGLLAEDVITAFDGRPVRNRQDLAHAIAQAAIGATLRVEATRVQQGRSKTVQVEVVLDEQPDGPAEAPTQGGTDPMAPLGVGLADLDARANRRLGRPARAAGVAVADVRAGTAGWVAGLRPGDVILEMDGQAVGTRAEALAVVAAARRRFLPLRVERERAEVYLSLDLRTP